jgi:galactose oxidase-like protein/Kelch motif protein
MPVDEYGGASASDGTYTYVFSGYSFNSGTLSTTLRYDPGADSWTQMAPIPLGGIMQSAVYDSNNNKIYVFGGEDADTGVNSNATYIYDIASDSWSTGANMPDVRAFMGAGWDDGTGHILGSAKKRPNGFRVKLTVGR